MFSRRVSILVGHFGSGKSEIAVNYSVSLASTGVPVSLVDLDVIKPYFRSRSVREKLAEAGVELVAPAGDNYYADLPIMLPRVRGLCRGQGADPKSRVIIDVGGDDAGARAVGSLADVLDPDDADVVAVMNFRRPLTPDPDSAVAMVRSIEGRARLNVNGIISNTHLMHYTTADIVREGYRLAKIAAEQIGTKVIAVTVPSMLENDFGADDFDCEIFPISPAIRTSFAADTAGDKPEKELSDDVGRSLTDTSGSSRIDGQYGVRKVGPLFVPAGMPDEEG